MGNKKNFENVRIDIIHNKSTIEVPSVFEKKARRYGTDEFKHLNAILAQFPSYEIVVKPTQKKKKRASTYKGLTYAYMETYITKHNKELLNLFNVKRGIPVEGMDAQPEKDSFKEIQGWFLEQFPEIKTFYETRATKKCA